MKMKNDNLNKVYNFINEFTENNGYAPTVRDICAGAKIKSTASVYLYINKLIENGMIDKAGNKRRALSTKKAKTGVKMVPVVGNIAAGKPIFAIENLEEYYPLPSDFSGSSDLFMLSVKGESMIDAGINDKDKIIVKKQESAVSGDIIVALVGEEVTVKRFKEKNGVKYLHPENKKMEDMYPPSFAVLGVVIGLLRKFA